MSINDIYYSGHLQKHEKPHDPPPDYEEVTLLISSRNKEARKEESFVAYKARWFVLGVFMSHLISNNVLWITFSPISNVTQCYYNISLFWVNALSWVYMLTYLLLSIPAVWFMERFGLKWTALTAGTLNAVGAWLRFAASNPRMFWLLFVGQTVTSFTYLMENNGCSKVSAIWFPAHERTLSTTLFSLFASNFGVLIGLLVGPLVVTGGENYNINVTCSDETAGVLWKTTAYDQFFYYLLGQALLATLVLPLTYLLPEAPPTRPSVTAHIDDSLPFFKQLRKAFDNNYFILLLITNGIMVASAGSYTTVFQEVLHNAGYDHYQNLIGYLGATMTIMSLIGVLIIGKWIDYTRKYYSTIVVVSFISVLITLCLSLCIQFKVHFYFVFVAATLTSAVLSLNGGITFEFAVEMTYPLPESISAGLLNLSFQIFGILMIIAVGQLVSHHLAMYGNYVFTGLLLISSIIMIFVRPTLRRVKIEKDHKKK